MPVIRIAVLVASLFFSVPTSAKRCPSHLGSCSIKEERECRCSTRELRRCREGICEKSKLCNCPTWSLGGDDFLDADDFFDVEEGSDSEDEPEETDVNAFP